MGPLFGKERTRQALQKLGIEPSVRAEVLDCDQFRALARALNDLDSFEQV
ncbi:MAG: hypothetical protein HN348_14160 [Proteobacteria bacterium]|nr:hypothetical protein [Pseudomonadota bacterium]